MFYFMSWLVYYYIVSQCSKLRFYFVHLPGAKTPHSVHPAICPCVAHCISLFKSWKRPAHTGCTAFKPMHPAAELCTPGAGCTLNFEHCLLKGLLFHLKGKETSHYDLA